MPYPGGAPQRPVLPGINQPKQQPGLEELIAMLTGGGMPSNAELIPQGGNSRLDAYRMLSQQGGPTQQQAVPSTPPPSRGLGNILNPAAAENLFQQNQPPAGLGGYSAMEPQTVMEPVDPNQSLLEMLLGSAEVAEPSSTDLSAMLGQATAGVGKPFDAQIGLIKHENQGAKADSRTARKKIKAMYRALAKDQQAMAEGEVASGAALSQQLEGLGAQSAQNLGNATEQILNQNAAAGNALGSPELTAALTQPAAEQGQRLAGSLVSDANAQATNQLGMSGVNDRYFRKSAGSSLLEGTNRRADLLGNLQDYLASQRAKIGDLAGQKAQTISGARNSVLSKFAAAQDNASNQGFENKLDIVKWWSDLQNNIADRDLKEQSMGQDSQNPLASLMPKNYGNAQQLAQAFPQLQGVIGQVTGNPEFMSGYTTIPGTKSEVPLANNPAAIQAFLQAQGIMPNNPQDLSALVSILLNLAPPSQKPSY